MPACLFYFFLLNWVSQISKNRLAFPSIKEFSRIHFRFGGLNFAFSESRFSRANKRLLSRFEALKGSTMIPFWLCSISSACAGIAFNGNRPDVPAFCQRRRITVVNGRIYKNVNQVPECIYFLSGHLRFYKNKMRETLRRTQGIALRKRFGLVTHSIRNIISGG